MADTIGDFLTRIRNAVQAGHRIVEVPASNLKKEMTKILKEKGYIMDYKFEDDSKQGVIKINADMQKLITNSVLWAARCTK